MSMKKLAMLTAFAGLAMSAQGMVGSGYPNESKPKRRVLSLNERRKCFYKYCKNMRPNATDLYCCEECKIRARRYQRD